MTEPPVLVEPRGHTLLVTINRPRAANSISAEVHALLGAAWDRADADPEIRAVVLTGAGERVFSGGADLRALAEHGRDGITPPETAHWGFGGVVDHPISKPIVAAVNGAALGGGTELALASDLIVAAEHASFGFPEIHRGIIAAAGGAIRITSALPRHVALELLLTGTPMPAADALRWGLVNRVVPQAEVLGTALALADRIAAAAPLAVQASKRLACGIVDGTTPHERDAWARNTAERDAVGASADAAEGVAAFLQKRDPVWQAR